MVEVKELIPKPKTRFLKVKCNGCGNEQVIFSAPSTQVKCNVCNQVFGKTTASKLKIDSKKAKIVKVLE
jgi:small subunit ribosomal protein S27e